MFDVPVETIPSEFCRDSNEGWNITAPSGYISSLPDVATGCDAAHPWVIVAQPGQRINLTLFDFTIPVPSNKTKNSTVVDSRVVCRQYGMVSDVGRRNSFPLCGTDMRKTTVLHSRGNIVKIWLSMGSTRSKDASRFVLQFSGEEH